MAISRCGLSSDSNKPIKFDVQIGVARPGKVVMDGVDITNHVRSLAFRSDAGSSKIASTITIEFIKIEVNATVETENIDISD